MLYLDIATKCHQLIKYVNLLLSLWASILCGLTACEVRYAPKQTDF